MFVYQIVNKINNKKYIGITSRTLEKRFKEHKKHLNCGIAAAIIKYGEDNFYIEKLEECSNWEDLLEKEKLWINKINPEYNKTLGGEGLFGFNHSEETKNKISLKNKGKPASDPKGDKLKEYKELYGNFWTGKNHTEEYKKLKSIDRLNYYQTERGKKQREEISKTLKEKGIRPPDYALGSSKGTKWWNNGKINKRSIESPGEDFISGRIKGKWKWNKTK
jgi:group I intron endonuclease